MLTETNIEWICINCKYKFYNENFHTPKKCPKCDGKYLYRTTEEYQKQKYKKPILTTNELKIKVMEHLLRKEKGEATEALANYIKELAPFYTLKTDEKPEMWTYEEGIYKPCGYSTIQEISRSILGEIYTKNLATKIAEKIQADTFIEAEEFFEEKKENIHLLPVKNGILNLKTRKLQPFTPEKIFFTKLPVEFIPGKDCPAIKKHFEEVIAFKQDTKVIQEMFGYLLWKENTFEKAFLLYGPRGRNGKSKTTELMKRFIGVENITTTPAHQFETDPYALGEVLKKMANISQDLDKHAINNTGPFRELTGRDMITAPRKFLNRVKFTPYAKMIYLCNDLAIPSDANLAFWNRWVFVEFPYSFLPEEEYNEKQKISEQEACKYKLRDPEIIEKISTPEELSGLLNWALDGLDRLLHNKNFSTSMNTEQIRDKWLRKSNSFTAFCMDWLEEEYGCKIKTNDLKEAYSLYCQEYRVKSDLKNHKDILHDLFNVFSRRESTGDRDWYWDGIKFKNNIQGYVLNVSSVLMFYTIEKKYK